MFDAGYSQILDIKEYEFNRDCQDMYTNGELQKTEVPLMTVNLFNLSNLDDAPIQMIFFFYQNKWRNTDFKSIFGARTFDKGEIRPTMFAHLHLFANHP